MTTRTRSRRSLTRVLHSRLAHRVSAVTGGAPPPTARTRSWRRAVRAEPGAAFPLAVRRRADRRDQDGHQGRRGRRDEHAGLEGRDLRLRRGRRQPDRLRRRRDVRGQRPRLLHPRRPGRVHDVAARAGPRLRLGHPQVVPDVRRTRRTAATTPRRSRSTNSGTSTGSATTSTSDDDSDYLDAVVQTFSRTKPNTGWNMHAFGRCDTATLQLRYDMAQLEREVLDLPRPRRPS